MNKPDAAAKGHLGTNCALDYITFSGAVACGTMTNVGKMCGLFFDPITDPSLAQSVVGVCGKKTLILSLFETSYLYTSFTFENRKGCLILTLYIF